VVERARALGVLAFEEGGMKGPSSSSEEEGDGDLSCLGWCANQPRLYQGVNIGSFLA
jgi:hypothetical protein